MAWHFHPKLLCLGRVHCPILRDGGKLRMIINNGNTQPQGSGQRLKKKILTISKSQVLIRNQGNVMGAYPNLLSVMVDTISQPTCLHFANGGMCYISLTVIEYSETFLVKETCSHIFPYLADNIQTGCKGGKGRPAYEDTHLTLKCHLLC